jgi:hypothetical protein
VGRGDVSRTHVGAAQTPNQALQQTGAACSGSGVQAHSAAPAAELGRYAASELNEHTNIGVNLYKLHVDKNQQRGLLWTAITYKIRFIA